jgi:hypothetical protein
MDPLGSSERAVGTTGLAGSPKSKGLTDHALLIHCLARIFLTIRHICIRIYVCVCVCVCIYIYIYSRAEIKQFETFLYIVRDNSPCG